VDATLVSTVKFDGHYIRPVKRIFGVSNLSGGEKPKGKGPNPRRRRRRRSADRQVQAGTAVNADVATGSISPPEVSLKGNNTPLNENKDGSVSTASNLAGDKLASGEGNAKRNPHNKRRRYPYRKNKAKRFDDMRNIRSAPQKTPDAAFTEVHVSGTTRPANSPEHVAADRNHDEQGNNRSRDSRFRNNHRRPSNAYAALDLGTNNCRLLIAVPQERGGFRVIDGFSRIVRLGEGLSQTGRLSQEAMDRSVEALKICAGKLNNRRIRRQRLIATEACRQASNGAEFLERVKRESGLELEIVTRETEARLATEGCGSLMDRKSDAAVLFDIGGGSSELILVSNAGARKKRISERIAAWTSLPMGVVTLSERFGGQNVSRKVFDDMVSEVMTHINAFEERKALKAAFAHGRVHLLGTSGTVTTLAGIHLKLPRYDRKRVDGIWLRDDEIDRVIDKLLSMSYEERSRNPCIGTERADLVLAGCAILNAIRQTWPANRLRVADRGLREGLLAEMMSLDGIGSRVRRNNRNSRNRGANKNHPSGNQQGSQ